MSRRDSLRQVTGIVLLDKPTGMSSNHALQAVRRLYRAAKAGHTGSLDPLATGLLPICLGEATKIAGWLLGARKDYLVECRLGVRTTTDDADGEVVQTRALPPGLDTAVLDQSLAKFVGTLQQIPPAFSALKRGGVPAYVRARRGEDVHLEAREVHIDAISVVGWQPPLLRLEIACGSGTYVRALVRDLGEQLGCGGHVTALRRQWVEPFRHPCMRTLTELEAMSPTELDAGLLPITAGLETWPRVDLDDAAAQVVRHGGYLATRVATGRYRVHGPDGRLLALVEHRGDGQLRVLRGFNAGSVQV